MQRPVLSKRPTEIFGCPYIDDSVELKNEIRQQNCLLIFVLLLLNGMLHTEDEFILNIIRKGVADDILNKSDYLEYF
ncbi:MAG: hypothetical protein LBQ88_20570 [Treponema sp.]|jgi:hypothetical protein|nr:hypothetical protein [Treponema sp.]